MTLDQLIELLQERSAEGHGEKSVMFTYSYGDYWRTTVACGVDKGEVGVVKHSPYHDMYKVVYVSDDETSQPMPGSSQVILLS